MKKQITLQDIMDTLQDIHTSLFTRIDMLEFKLSDKRPDAESRPENVQDKFAEQRKLIGKICKFWDDSDEPENCVYDILYNIYDITHHEDCPFQCGNGEWYEHCEPVKPDDDIIYKGE